MSNTKSFLHLCQMFFGAEPKPNPHRQFRKLTQGWLHGLPGASNGDGRWLERLLRRSNGDMRLNGPLEPTGETDSWRSSPEPPAGTDKGPACVETSGEDETDGGVGAAAYWMASPEAPVGTDAGPEGAETPG